MVYSSDLGKYLARLHLATTKNNIYKENGPRRQALSYARATTKSVLSL